MNRTKVIIMGAAGRDFHNFNVFFRNNKNYEVAAFTAAQIPNIEGRMYPPDLAGNLYPKGIPIYGEDNLNKLIKKRGVHLVVFSYSDVSHLYVMHKASQVIAAGANFMLMGAEDTMLKSKKPIVSVCAVRTGCGKSQTTRRVSSILREAGKKVVVVRHPMPYGDLSKQAVQRFATIGDLSRNLCTIEEMEEYEPHISRGVTVYAGVDYEAILRKAEREADIILWDGGNNDLPLYKPDIEIVVVDPHRAGHETAYYPGEANLRRAGVIVINKIDTADLKDVETVRNNIALLNPSAMVIDGASPITVDNPELIRGKKVLVVEDGPTLTHGEMKYGAGIMAAKRFGASEIVDPRQNAAGTIKETFRKYPDIGTLLPAMGYNKEQIKDLEATINKTKADVVIIATPINLNRLIKINKPSLRVSYDLEEIGRPTLRDALKPLTRR